MENNLAKRALATLADEGPQITPRVRPRTVLHGLVSLAVVALLIWLAR